MDFMYVTDTSKVFHKWEKNELQDFKPIKQYINIGAQPILTFLTVIFPFLPVVFTTQANRRQQKNYGLKSSEEMRMVFLLHPKHLSLKYKNNMGRSIPGVEN